MKFLVLFFISIFTFSCQQKENKKDSVYMSYPILEERSSLIKIKYFEVLATIVIP